MTTGNAKAEALGVFRTDFEDELPPLTSKQEAFVHALLQGKSASEAYRLAYDAANMADRTVWSEASRLRSSPKVAAWLSRFQRIGLETGRVTFESHLGELARAREVALASGQVAAGVQAEHYRGKAAGLYENRLRLTVAPSDEDLLKDIERLLGKEIAEAVRAALV